jgi:hypothetical protein
MKQVVCDACGKELGRGELIHNAHALEVRIAAVSRDDAYAAAHFCSWRCLAEWATQRDDDARSGKPDITAPAPPPRPRIDADPGI